MPKRPARSRPCTTPTAPPASTPDTIELVEAHGTGTRVGDAVEAAALTEVYRETGREGTWCALGSVKSQIGHTKAAAGAAGLIKAALALHHKVLPPTIKVERPLDGLQPGTTPFYVNTEKRPWLPSPDHPRRAGVSAFGFGGSNFHCVLEEAEPDKTEVDWDGDVQLLAFAADSPAALDARLAAWPADLSWDELRIRAAETRAAWEADAACRLVLPVAARADGPGEDDRRRTRAAGQAGRQEIVAQPGRRLLRFRRPGRHADRAVLRTGRAVSRHVARSGLHVSAGACRRWPTRIAFMRNGGGTPRLCDLIYPLSAFTPEERAANEAALRATDAAQPALGAVSLGAWRVLESFGIRADAFAGHSYGELIALCAAGRIGPDDLHALSLERGRLMAAAPAGGEAGGMLAVHAPAETITQVLSEEKIDLVLANKNAPQQTVLSGPAAADRTGGGGVRGAAGAGDAPVRGGGVPQPAGRRRRTGLPRCAGEDGDPSRRRARLRQHHGGALPGRRRPGPRSPGRPAGAAGRVGRRDRKPVPRRRADLPRSRPRRPADRDGQRHPERPGA